MNGLYPLKFKPVYLEKIWGGSKIKTILNKNFDPLPNCGESWELSGVEGNISEVSNGFLAGNNLQELIDIYMGDLVGEKNFEKFGIEFPLLIKFIDAKADLSIQVHPNDELAQKRHNAYGKTEMWYVIDADKGSRLNSGFNRELDKEQYLEYIKDGNLMDILAFDDVKKGDAIFMPAGRVHAIGAGVMVAEIQQTSDVTYRIFDFNRKDSNGKERELHTDLALDAIDFKYQKDFKINYEKLKNKSSEIVDCQYFTTNILDFDEKLEKDFYAIDSFIIYICLEGEFRLDTGNGSEKLTMGEIILVPAFISSFSLKPISKKAKTLEVYIK